MQQNSLALCVNVCLCVLCGSNVPSGTQWEEWEEFLECLINRKPGSCGAQRAEMGQRHSDFDSSSSVSPHPQMFPRYIQF